MIEGDFFSWHWTAAELERRTHSAYHCRSQMCVYTRGKLRDTYWSTGANVLAPHQVCITYLGNINEMKPIHAGDIPFYKASDVVDTRHSNDTTAPVFVKPDAKPCPRALLDHYRSTHEEALANLATAKARVRATHDPLGGFGTFESAYYLAAR